MYNASNTLRVNGEGAPESALCPAILLAGGRGSRLHELTDRECKPALAFGDNTCLVDFSLSNATNSGIRHIMVATQYCPWQLHAHLGQIWRPFLHALGGALDVRHGPSVTKRSSGYLGTAAALSENIAHIDALAPRNVLILAADHVYRMDYRPMLAAHQDSGADLTVAAAVVPCAEASGFGIIDADSTGRIRGFLEKPANPPSIPGDALHSLASMGIYVFRWKALRAALLKDSEKPDSQHDFGFDIVPDFVVKGRAMAFPLESPVPGVDAYWRDVGTLDSYRRAYLEVLGRSSPLAFTEARWPVLPQSDMRTGLVDGAGDAECSFISASARVGDAEIRNSVVMAGAQIGAGSRLRDCIIGPGAVVRPGTVLGETPEEDAYWFRRDAGGTLLATADMLNAQQEQISGRNAVLGYMAGSVVPG